MIEDGIKFLGVDASVPTPENRSSQSNGLSSMVTIEEIAEKVGAINGGSSEYTETIVNISSAQILAMGTTPIELLPAAGVGKYYDIDKIVLECKMQGIDYVVDAGSYLYISEGIKSYVDAQILRPNSISEDTYSIMRFSPDYDSSDGIPMLGNLAINRAVTLDYYSDSGITPTPTTGTATLRVKIYHKTITFGA